MWKTGIGTSHSVRVVINVYVTSFSESCRIAIMAKNCCVRVSYWIFFIMCQRKKESFFIFFPVCTVIPSLFSVSTKYSSIGLRLNKSYYWTSVVTYLMECLVLESIPTAFVEKIKSASIQRCMLWYPFFQFVKM